MSSNHPLLALLLAPVLTLGAIGDSHAQRPNFQMPVPCGQSWDLSTYSGAINHWPDADSLDMAQRDEDLNNISEGEPVLASAAGVVSDVFTRTSDGENRIYVDHGDDWYTHYIHVDPLPPLSVGQEIALGEQIARTGKSGAASVHIHYAQLREEEGDARRAKFNGVSVDTHAGDTSTHGHWGTSQAETVRSVNCAGNSFMTWQDGGENYVLIYKPTNGDVKIKRLDSDGAGSTNTWSGEWSRRWTHMFPFTTASGHRHAIVYKSSTGKVAYLHLDANGSGVTNLRTTTWGTGWTHFVRFQKAGDPHFLAYNSLYGGVSVDRIDPDGDSITNVLKTNWSKGRTSLVPYRMGGNLYLLVYKGGSGDVQIKQITGSGEDLDLTTVWSGTWMRAWTDLVPLQRDGKKYLLAYKAHNGAAKVLELQANGQGAVTRESMTWTSPWTAFTPFTIDDRSHVLLYKLHTGDVKTIRLNANGNGFTTLWDGTWTKGWA